MQVRNYLPTDYSAVKRLYIQSDLYGGQFDEARDSEERLNSKIKQDPQSILVAVENNSIIGTISLIEDGRVAWLFRFAVMLDRNDVVEALYQNACSILIDRGHSQVLVYSPVGKSSLDQRYNHLGMTHGGSYSCYWAELKQP